MFDKLKSLFGGNDKIAINAFAIGKSIDIKNVNDPTFSSGILGAGVAIENTSGKIFAPCDGKIIQVFDTLHAIVLESSEGAELLIHIGIDTVTLKGEGFKAFVKSLDQVKKGDLLIEFDTDFIKSKGFDDTVIMVVCNTDNFSSIDAITGIDTDLSKEILTIKK